MKRLCSLLFVPAALVLLAGSPVDPPRPANNGTAGGCVQWQTEARWSGLAYDHLVHLNSECDKAMTCEVTTDVNPEVTTAKVAPGKNKTVTTFVGSPASDFSANVVCTGT